MEPYQRFSGIPIPDDAEILSVDSAALGSLLSGFGQTGQKSTVQSLSETSFHCAFYSSVV